MPALKNKNFLLIILIIVLAASLITTPFFINKKTTSSTPDSSTLKETNEYQQIPIFPDGEEISFYQEEGLITATYQTPVNTNPKAVLNYYQQQFENNNWSPISRDESQITYQTLLKAKFRVWIYYIGQPGEGTMYNTDYVPENKELLSIPIQ